MGSLSRPGVIPTLMKEIQKTRSIGEKFQLYVPPALSEGVLQNNPIIRIILCNSNNFEFRIRHSSAIIDKMESTKTSTQRGLGNAGTPGKVLLICLG
jgi:hypothetical protein